MKYTTVEFITKASQLHDNKYDYSKVIYVNSRTKVDIVCPKHGVFKQLPSSHLYGNGCPKCAREWSDAHKQHHTESSRRSRGMTTSEWIAKAREVHGDKYDYSRTVYVNQRTDVEIICPIHGVFTQKADSHIRGCGCRLCGLQSEGRKNGIYTWSDERRAKTMATCLEKYGAVRFLDSQEGKDKIAKIKSDPAFRSKMHDIISSNEVQEKTKATSLQKYGVISPVQTKAVKDKIYMSKKKNHTVNSSKVEAKMYDLLVKRFGINDVIYQYKCNDVYPFICDFYIKSLNLFIELNAHWSHGKHWFDKTNLDDVATLAVWKEKAKNSAYYRVAIRVWTEYDLLKRQTAVTNNLNYVVFWDNNLADFMQWLNSDELQLKLY